jgi:ubiquinone/menaquinone biosynthesis C-methylase UbiE
MEKKVQEHFDKIGGTYHEEISKHVRDHLFTKWWDLVHKWVKPDGSVLDVGCGDGTVVQSLRTRGINAVGIDGSQSLIMAGQKRYPEVVPFLSVGDAKHLNYRDCTFDNVLLIGVLHHIHSREDQLRVVRECLRVLKPGGYLLIRECNIRNPLFRLYWNYVFPLTAKIDRFGGENWIPVDMFLKWGLHSSETKFFTFLPSFTPSWMMPIASRVENKLELSFVASLAAHYSFIIPR